MPTLTERRQSVLTALDALFAHAADGTVDHEATEWSQEKQEQYDNLMAEEKEIRAIEDRQDAVSSIQERMEARARRAQDDGDTRSLDELTQQAHVHQEELRAWALDGELQAAQTTADAKGGYTIPTIVAPDIESIMTLGGPMLSIVNMQPRGNGQPFQVPTSDYSTIQAQSIAENTESEDGDDLAFGEVTLNFDNFATDILTVSRELLEDSEADIDAEVTNVLASWMGAGLSRTMTTGVGGTNIDGFEEHASYVKAVTTAAKGTVAYTEVINLRGSIYMPHRAGRRFMFTQSMETYLQGIKSHDNTPVIGASIREQGDAGLRCASLPYTINEDLLDHGAQANRKLMACGNFRSYRAFRTGPYELLRFEDSPYAKKRIVGFMMQCRRAGKLVTASGAAGNRQPIKYLANGA